MANINAGDLNLLICGGLFALIFGGVGLMLLLIRNRDQSKADESKSWPVAMGTVTRSDLGVVDDDGTTYFPVVEYSYAVGDQLFHGNRVSFGPVSYYRSPQSAEVVLAQYELGSEVKVYYKPEKPQEAVLQSRASKTKLGLIVPIILIGLMALILLTITVVFLWMVISG